MQYRVYFAFSTLLVTVVTIAACSRDDPPRHAGARDAPQPGSNKELEAARDPAGIDLTHRQINQMAGALNRFRLDLRRYPTEEENISALWNGEALEEERDQDRWNGPYIDPIREDAWGNDWIYRYPGEIRGEQYYDLLSMGPDGEEGTDDDITNHDRLHSEDGEIDLGDDFRF